MLYINSSVHEFAYKIKQVWIKTLPNLKDHKKTRSKYFQFWFMFWRHFFTLIYLHLLINDPQPYHTSSSHTLLIFVYNMLSSRHFNRIRTLTTWSFPKNLITGFKPKDNYRFRSHTVIFYLLYLHFTHTSSFLPYGYYLPLYSIKFSTQQNFNKTNWPTAPKAST